MAGGTCGDTLNNCPFCGGEAERVDIEDGENAGGSCIACKQCMASSNVEFGFKENFVSNWNRRAQPEEREHLANALDPEIGFPSDYLLRCIHADLETRGRKNADFAVTVHHRNIVLSAVANALRSSDLLTWDEWLEHCNICGSGDCAHIAGRAVLAKEAV